MPSGKEIVERMKERNRQKLNKKRGGKSIEEVLAEKKKKNQNKMKKETGMGASKVEEAKAKIRSKLMEKYDKE